MLLRQFHKCTLFTANYFVTALKMTRMWYVKDLCWEQEHASDRGSFTAPRTTKRTVTVSNVLLSAQNVVIKMCLRVHAVFEGFPLHAKISNDKSGGVFFFFFAVSIKNVFCVFKQRKKTTTNRVLLRIPGG